VPVIVPAASRLGRICAGATQRPHDESLTYRGGPYFRQAYESPVRPLNYTAVSRRAEFCFSEEF